MLSFLLYIGASKFLALDIGSAFTKGYVFEDMKQPEIAFNIVGRRLTPTYIGFRADKQFNLSGPIPITHKEGYLLNAAIGDKALQYIRHRPWSATGHLPNFIDITTEKQEEIAKRFHVNTTAARIPVEMLYPMFIQLMARELRPDEQVDGISVSVPAHYSVMQRQIIRNAIMSTGIYCDVICDEATAVATAFATSYPKSFVNERINVLFVDIGASSSKAYIYSFLMKSDTAPPEITRKSYAYDDKIGGDDITISLAKHIMQTHNLNNVDNANFYRILDVAEKIKVKLSLSQKAMSIFYLQLRSFGFSSPSSFYFPILLKWHVLNFVMYIILKYEVFLMTSAMQIRYHRTIKHTFIVICR